MKPILFIMSGLPGSGKSTLSRFLARKYKIPYIQIDTIEQGLRDLCDVDVITEGYELSYRIAVEQLRLGINLVVDSCNPINLTRMAWEDVENRLFHPWKSERIVIDTAHKSIDESQNELDRKILCHLGLITLQMPVNI